MINSLVMRLAFLVFGMFFIVLVVDIIFRFLHYRREEKLLNRLMARDYKEYQYFEREHEKDIEEKEAIRDEAREERDDFREEQKLEEEIKRAQEKTPPYKMEDFEEDFEELEGK